MSFSIDRGEGTTKNIRRRNIQQKDLRPILLLEKKLVKCELFPMENPQIQAQRSKDTEFPIGMEASDSSSMINPQRSRFPYCIVWTPIPVLT